MSEFLFEIGFEELPADYLKPAAQQLKDDFEKLLTEKRIKAEKTAVTYTVRRFVLTSENMAASQEDVSQEKKGPRHDIAYKEGKLTDIGKKFLESNKIKEDGIKIKEEKGQKYLYADIFEKGRPSKEILAENLAALIKGLKFPKVMTWDSSLVTFARPLRWIVCLLNGEIVDFSYGSVRSGVKTRLHKFLHRNAEADVKNTAGYFETMKKNGLLLYQQERKDAIIKETEALLLKENLKILPDEGLLEMLASSVESVSVMKGEFDEKYLFLPDKVIITAMREHQRYFAVVKADGSFTNSFINVRDGGLENADFVVKQHAKVLFSRLNDAEFFYKEDLKEPLSSFTPRLKEAVFITGLGTMFEKTQRIAELASGVGEDLGKCDTAALVKAAEICKSDLMTNMVGEKEYVGLRGFMGGVYLKAQSADERVCKAVSSHYYPNAAGDRLPETSEGIALSILDKIDNVTGFFAAGFKPTGSKDPYAVRRQALNIIYMILEKELDFDLSKLIDASVQLYDKQLGKSADGAELKDFFRQRELNYFKDRQIDYDIANAVLTGTGINIMRDFKKGAVLCGARKKEGFNETIFSLSRINNILPKDYSPAAVNPGLFEDVSEKALYEKAQEAKPVFESGFKSADFEGCLSIIEGLKPFVDSYFDKVLVNAEDADKKSNRLNTLAFIKLFLYQFADFSKIVIDRK